MKKIIYPLFVGIISTILIGSVIIFFQSFQHLRSNKTFRTQQTHRPMIEISQIQSWMTFDYLNHCFNLSPDYLKNILLLSDDMYPKITIRRAATLQGEATMSFVERVKEAIKVYPSVTPASP